MYQGWKDTSKGFTKWIISTGSLEPGAEVNNYSNFNIVNVQLSTTELLKVTVEKVPWLQPEIRSNAIWNASIWLVLTQHNQKSVFFPQWCSGWKTAGQLFLMAMTVNHSLLFLNSWLETAWFFIVSWCYPGAEKGISYTDYTHASPHGLGDKLKLQLMGRISSCQVRHDLTPVEHQHYLAPYKRDSFGIYGVPSLQCIFTDL